MSKITINGVTVDPLVQGPALAAANLRSADATDSDYILIQTAQPLSKDMKRELNNMGVVILEYVPDDTYLCNYKGTDLDQIRSLANVVWANIYMQGFKISPSLTTRSVAAPAGIRNLLDIAAAPARTLSTTFKVVDVVFHSNVDPRSIQDKLSAAAHLNASDLRIMPHKIRLNVQIKHLNELASIDEVRHIEEVLPMKLHNDVARVILNLEPPPNLATTFEGQGQTVAVADTGFDKGSTADVHEAFTGRVARLYALGRANANDPNGHGTHVAGSVLGDGDSASLGHNIRGTAPAARLVLQSVLDSVGGLGGLPDDLNDLFQPPYDDDGARIHTNSWGNTLGDGRYNSNSREVDEFIWEHRDCVICFSAGNEGVDHTADSGEIDPKSITPPATSKNCITIGASENDRPNFDLTYQQAFGATDYPANPIASDRMANDPDGMVAFSSRGPTTDGRIKPDVVAPGSYILSTRSRDTSDTGWASSADPLYYFLGGTSMATPLVAGCAAVVREYLSTERQITTPSAALVKAMLVNGAQDLAGQYVPSEARGIPNNSEGFGRVDMAATLSELVQVQDEATALDVGDEETVTVHVGGGASLKVTLVWTDRPGSTLQNDLDLIVRTADDQERHGNVAPNSTAFDRDNNVEQVIWENVPAGDVDIIVRAHRIPLLAQSYALVTRIEGGGRPPRELEINGPELQGEINPAGEQDLYTLNITTEGTYTISTSGTTDTFLSLFGPDSETTLVAADDESGPGTLSLLVQDLVVGKYIVQVRHFSPAGRGPYGISVASNTNPAPVQMEVDGPEVQGDIGQPAESDLFTFSVATAGEYSIETSGSTDTFLALFGPNSDTNLITQDDDSGPGLLSRIQESLAVGTYFVRVRHFSPAQTGVYGIRVRRV
jgi:serine protease AprX